MAMQFLVVFIGAGLGAICRFACSTAWPWQGQGFPWATSIVNIVGCIIIGIVLGFVNKHDTLSDSSKLFLTTGFCGGLTTFSTFGIEAFTLLKNGQYAMCIAYVLINVIVGIGLCGIAWRAVERMHA